MSYRKRIILIGSLTLSAILAVSILFACSTERALKGVEAENGELKSVTFKLPDGVSIGTALGSRIGDKHTIGVGYMRSGKEAAMPEPVYWATVDSGGIVSWRDSDSSVYRYAPKATVSSGDIPPAYAALYEEPPASSLFDPKDVGELENRYGVVLHLSA